MKGFGKCVAVRICPRFWFREEGEMKSWLCHDEIRVSSDEIFGVPPQMKLNPPPYPAARQISSRSDFIHRRWIAPATADFVEKSTCLCKCFFLCRVSDLNAKPCVYDLDARLFCRGYTNPVAMMGVALVRGLSG